MYLGFLYVSVLVHLPQLRHVVVNKHRDPICVHDDDQPLMVKTYKLLVIANHKALYDWHNQDMIKTIHLVSNMYIKLLSFIIHAVSHLKSITLRIRHLVITILMIVWSL